MGHHSHYCDRAVAVMWGESKRRNFSRVGLRAIGCRSHFVGPASSRKKYTGAPGRREPSERLFCEGGKCEFLKSLMCFVRRHRPSHPLMTMHGSLRSRISVRHTTRASMLNLKAWKDARYGRQLVPLISAIGF